MQRIKVFKFFKTFLNKNPFKFNIFSQFSSIFQKKKKLPLYLILNILYKTHTYVCYCANNILLRCKNDIPHAYIRVVE